MVESVICLLETSLQWFIEEMFRMGYGQHQSFYLRVNWLRKAIKQLQRDNRFFYDENAAELIGLGKNMVQSLRYWVVATDIVREVSQGRVYHDISEFGNLVNQFDPFIELRNTAAILHYHLTDDVEPSTTWYWYFNVFSSAATTKSELVEDLVAWIGRNDTKKPSENSLKRDIDCLVRLYCQGETVDDPEEVIQSPLAVIGLLKEEKGIVHKVSPKYSDIGLGALMYSLLKYKDVHGQTFLSVEEIEDKPMLWGRVFNLQRSEIINALERLTLHPYYPVSFDRTNKLNTVHLPDVSSMEFLRESYKRSGRETA